jgi:hypothetical protein
MQSFRLVNPTKPEMRPDPIWLCENQIGDDEAWNRIYA